MNYKIKYSGKHEKLINHFCRFIDKRWFLNFIPSQKQKENFIKIQTYGKKSISIEEYEELKPLIQAQEAKESQIKGLVEDIAYFWSMGLGWYLPLMGDIKNEFKDRHKTKDYIYIKALIKIARELQEDVLDFLMRYTGFDNERKQKYLNMRLKFALK